MVVHSGTGSPRDYKAITEGSVGKTIGTLNSDPYAVRLNEIQIELGNRKQELSDIKEELRKTIEANRSEFKTEIVKSERKSIEIIGIVSSIIGLGLGFVSAAKDQKDVFTTAVILLLTTCAFTIFATLIHHYFGGKEMQKETESILKWSVVSSIILLFISIIGQKRFELIMFRNFVITNPPAQLILFKNLFTINRTIVPAAE
jgi:hypothetical protein